MNRSPDFSLVLGGPLYQIWRRTRLADSDMDLMRRRILVMTAVAWVPLLVLSIVEGRAWGESVALPFIKDIEQHLRLLVALPLLIAGERVIHRRMQPEVHQFVERGLISEASLPAYDAAVNSSMRLRNSIVAEVLLIAVVYVLGLGLVWKTQTVMDVDSWNGSTVGELWRPTMAGTWLAFVSMPLFQFLMLRWYYRLFIWGRFLYKVSRLKLDLVPSHPDRSGGLGFLETVTHGFAPVLLAQGTLLAGMMANRIFYSGAHLPEFQVELIGLVAVMAFALLGPLLAFLPKLEEAKRNGLREYGKLAQRYVHDYDRKWIRGGAPTDEPFIGSADIQSLADLGNSFEVVKTMKWVPFGLPTVLVLAVCTLLPVAPLLLTMFPLEELLGRLVSVVL